QRRHGDPIAFGDLGDQNLVRSRLNRQGRRARVSVTGGGRPGSSESEENFARLGREPVDRGKSRFSAAIEQADGPQPAFCGGFARFGTAQDQSAGESPRRWPQKKRFEPFSGGPVP